MSRTASMNSPSAPLPFARPLVVASQCLGFAAVRYNGAIIHDDFVARLAPAVDFTEVCPEVAIGLGVPRAPIRMETRGGAVVLFQSATSRDITNEMTSYTTSFVDSVTGVDGFILKSRSPSCGTDGVSVFDGDTAVTTRAGMFAQAVLTRFTDLPIEDEIGLRDRARRRHFLTRIFALARFRAAAAAAAAGNASALVSFHTAYKYVLMAHQPARTTALGRIAAAYRPDALQAYGALLRHVLSTAPTDGGYVNALSHMAGYLPAQERAGLLEAIHSTDPLDRATPVLADLIARNRIGYLQAQAWFNPFPDGLLEPAGSAP